MDTEIRDIYVISDLHLGDFSNRDNFAKTPLKTKEGIEVDRIPQFRAFLDMVRKNNGSIVILGDLFEFWKASIGTVLSKNLDLLGELASFSDLTVILGNHDNDLADFISNPLLRLQESHPFFAKIQTGNYTDGVSDYTIMQKVFTRDDGHKLTIGFMHGHEVDAFNRNPQPAIGRVVTILAGLIQDVIGSPVLPKSGKVVEEDFMDKIHQIPLMGAWTIIKSCFKGIGRFMPLVVSYIGVLLLSIFSLWKSEVLWPQIIMLLFVILLPISDARKANDSGVFIEFTLSALYEIVAEQAKHQVEHEDKRQVELTDAQIAVLKSLKHKPLSRKEVSAAVQMNGDSRSYKRHIEPLLGMGFIEMTVPEKPNSRLQKYRLTEAGKRIILKL